MGVQNKQRRAAKRRRREQGRRDRPWGPPPTQDERRAVARIVLATVVDELSADPSRAEEHAGALLTVPHPVPLAVLLPELDDLLGHLVHLAVQGGWSPADLGEVVRRRLPPVAVPSAAALLAAVLTTETARHSGARVAAAWQRELAALGRPAAVAQTQPAGLAFALGLAAVLSPLPQIPPTLPPPGSAPIGEVGMPPDETKVLARVRALLAKAESTEFSEEAEALSAKAQELITRHRLERLLAHRGAQATRAVRALRLWLDAPYVMEKALLVSVVAQANDCRAVASVEIGFITVVGPERSLGDVEVLSTSLLVQASAAMLRHGRQADRYGRSRTTSFRRSFLSAYASRIGERLDAAARGAADATGRSAELVPVLAHLHEQVAAETERLFPHMISRTGTVSNGHGWAAGRAAADLALLDTDLAVRA